jgi:hypothetical protein
MTSSTVELSNLDKWIADLRTTDAPQCTGSLSEFVAWTVDPPEDEAEFVEYDVVGYCCLGRGEVARGATFEGQHTVGMDLATREFIDWLGVEYDEHHDRDVHDGDGSDYCNCGWDLVLDVPDQYSVGTPVTNVLPSRMPVVASNLNDSWHLTFPQIADMVAYFGIRTATTS